MISSQSPEPATLQVRRNLASVLSLESDGLIYHNLDTGRAFRINALILKILLVCSDWVSLTSLSELLNISYREIQQIVEQLLDEEILYLKDSSRFPVSAVSLAVTDGWSLFDLAAQRSAHHNPEYEYRNFDRGLCNYGACLQSECKRPIQLPISLNLNISLAHCLQTRRSRRQFGDQGVSLTKLSTLLDMAVKTVGVFTSKESENCLPAMRDDSDNSITGRLKYPYPVGAAYNVLQFYIAVDNINDISPGLYAYDNIKHILTKIHCVSLSKFSELVLDNIAWVKQSSFIVLVAADVLCRSHYRHAYKLAVLEAGHAIQNMLLLAEALDLSACQLGAIQEDNFLQIINAEGYSPIPLSAIAIGARMR